MIDRACKPPAVFPPGYGSRVPKLLVFPEMSLTGGYSGGPYVKNFVENGCAYIPGEETDKIAEKTAEHDVYIVGHCYERDDAFPGAFFNCSWIMEPDGKVLSKYRRIHTGVAVSPDEIFDDYIKKVGWDGLFPVVDTPLGKLAALPCNEINFPEIARMFGLQGVEIIAQCDGSGAVDPTLSTASSPVGVGFQINRRARAIENQCYVPRANRTDAEIIDYYGRTLARSSGPGEQIVKAPINMYSLRKRRAEFGASITRLRTHIFAHFYETITTWPPNQFIDGIPNNLQLAKDEFRKKAEKNSLKLGFLTPEALEETIQ